VLLSNHCKAKRVSCRSGRRGESLRDPTVGRLLRSFIIEMLVYAALVVGYFLLVLRLLGEPLYRLFSSNLVLYSVVALVLIVAQGVLLEAVTSFVIGWLGLDKLE
jgi:hypothetical protein